MANLTIRAREKVYSDIDFAFRPVPMQGDGQGDLARKKDVEAVKQSVLNILQTNRGEKPFVPSFGANLRSYLFETIDSVTISLIEEEIILALRNYEPRVRVISVDVEDLSEKNAISITLDFEIISPVQTTTTLEFIVERLR
jgi:uncharacterized protein